MCGFSTIFDLKQRAWHDQDCQSPALVVTVTVHGRPSAVLVAVEDLERLEETLAILRDAGTMARLAESDAELARGESVSAAELAETMRRRSSGE